LQVNITNTRYFQQLAWAGMSCMIIGFLFNRVVANVGFLLIGIYAFSHIKTSMTIWRKPWMWTFIGLALVHVISDIFTTGLDFISQRGTMKLLLVLFPFFVFGFRADRRQIKFLHYAWMIAMLIVCIHALTYYYTHYESVNAAYRVSKVMHVLGFGDHIRVSWGIVIACLMACYEYVHSDQRLAKRWLVAYVMIQIVFLHLLMSKMGLVMLYMTMTVLIISAIIHWRRWWVLAIFPLMALVPILSFKYVPSFEQRVRYMKYDWEHYSEGRYHDGLSDAVRFYSLIAGKDLIQESPYTGHGFSNLQTKTNEWYATNLPQMGKSSYFLPSSEIVIYWASAGLIGLLSILLHLVVPLFIKRLRRNVWFMAFFIPAAVSFLIETHLEGLLPLWVYGFWAAWFWWLVEKEL
jgi:O-antigen ligase